MLGSEFEDTFSNVLTIKPFKKLQPVIEFTQTSSSLLSNVKESSKDYEKSLKASLQPFKNFIQIELSNITESSEGGAKDSINTNERRDKKRSIKPRAWQKKRAETNHDNARLFEKSKPSLEGMSIKIQPGVRRES